MSALPSVASVRVACNLPRALGLTDASVTSSPCKQRILLASSQPRVTCMSWTVLSVFQPAGINAFPKSKASLSPHQCPAAPGISLSERHTSIETSERPQSQLLIVECTQERVDGCTEDCRTLLHPLSWPCNRATCAKRPPPIAPSGAQFMAGWLARHEPQPLMRQAQNRRVCWNAVAQSLSWAAAPRARHRDVEIRDLPTRI